MTRELDNITESRKKETTISFFLATYSQGNDFLVWVHQNTARLIKIFKCLIRYVYSANKYSDHNFYRCHMSNNSQLRNSGEKA